MLPNFAQRFIFANTPSGGKFHLELKLRRHVRKPPIDARTCKGWLRSHGPDRTPASRYPAGQSPRADVFRRWDYELYRDLLAEGRCVREPKYGRIASFPNMFMLLRCRWMKMVSPALPATSTSNAPVTSMPACA